RRACGRHRTDQEDFRMSEERSLNIEEVDRVEAPPRARLSDAPETESAAESLGRKKDYLAGFLAQKPQDGPPGEPGGDLYEAVVAALKDIYDPEIPVNIYALGLIYAVEVSPDADVAITMTLTTPHCPVAE